MSLPVLVFVACAVACGVAHVAILLSTVRGRAATAVATNVTPLPRSRAAVEALWALVPVVVLALVLTATWARVREQAARVPEVMKVAQ